MNTENDRKWFIKTLASVGLGVSFVFLALVLLGVTGVMPVLADTPVPSPINSDDTWGPGLHGGNPYLITGTVLVQAKLTILPGTEVQFSEDGLLQIGNGGQLIAVGTPAEAITFTSRFTKARGTWDGIRFVATSLTGTIQYAVIEYSKVGVELSEGEFHNVSSNTFRYIGDELDPSNSGVLVGSPDNNILNYNVAYSSVNGIRLKKPGDNQIIGNRVYDIDNDCLAFVSDSSSSSGGNDIFNNELFNCGSKGITLDDNGTGTNNQIIGNVISNTRDDAIALSNQRLFTVTNNVVYNIPYTGIDGVSFSNFQFQSVVHNNAICVDDQYEVNNTTGIALTANGNWLGTNTPANPPEFSNDVNVNPTIIFSATSAASALPADGVSTTVITITMNDGAGHVVPPLARTVNLTASMGTLSQPSVTLNANGVATVIFTAPAAFGNVIITATEFCNYVVTATVTAQAADLAISKTPLVTQVTPGGLISYTIHYTNLGNIAANNVVITDILPANTTFNSANAPGFSGAGTVWTRNNPLAAGDGGVITLTARVADQSVIGCTPGGLALTNTVRIDSSTLDTDLSNNVYTTTAADRITVVCADVAIRKFSTQPTVSPGETVTYTIVYSNIGDAVAYNVGITDVNPINGSIDTLPNVVSPLQPGDSYTTVYTVTADDTICNREYLTNTAVISTVTPETDYANNIATTDSSTSPRVQCYDLAITKTTVIPWAVPGQTVTYTVEYTNASNTNASGVVITDALPEYTTYQGDSSGLPVTVSPDVVTWTVGSLAAHNGGSFVLTATIGLTAGNLIPDPGRITNVVTIRGGSSELTITNNISSAVIRLQSGVNLVTVKNDGVGTGDPRLYAQAGEYITYTISVNNIGNELAANVVLTDTLPAHTTFDPARSSPGWTTGDGVHYTIGLPNLPGTSGGVGGGVIRTFAVQVDPNLPCAITEVVNTAFADSDGLEIDYSDNTSHEQTPVECIPIALSKDDGNIFCAVPGQNINYTISVTNNSSSSYTNLLLTEYPDSHTYFINVPPGLWPLTAPYTHSIGALGPSTTSNTPFLVQIDPLLPAGINAVTNVVQLDPTGLTFSLTTPISRNLSDLYVVKNDNIEQISRQKLDTIARLEAQLGPVEWLEALKDEGRSPQAHYVSPGDVISYSIGYGNSGDIAANNVVITETIPENTQFLGPTYWTHQGGRTYVYNRSNLPAGGGGELFLYVQVDTPFPNGVPGVTNTIRIASDATFECNPGDNLSVEFTPVQNGPSGPTTIYLPIVLKNWPPPDPVAQLSWRNKDNDEVSELDGAAGLAADGRNDGLFELIVNTGLAGYSRTIDWIELSSSQSGTPRWNTPPGDSIPVMAVYLGGSRLNSIADGSVTHSLNNQETYTLYLSDDAGYSRFVCYPQQYNYTVIVHFDDGASATANTGIPPCPPAGQGSWVSDVAADPTTNQVFIASPRENAVHVINGALDEYTQAIGVGREPTGLAVLTSTTPSKVAVAHINADNYWNPGAWYINTQNLSSHSQPDLGGYVGAAPVKVTANPFTNRFYYSNYFDRMPIVNAVSEDRIDWVFKKNFQASYGIEVSPQSNMVYMAAIDTGELIIFDAAQAEADPANYGACHNAPPEGPVPGTADARILRMVAVNPNTGHVFVTSPPDPNPDNHQNDSRVYVLDEATLLAETGGHPSDTTCTWNFGRTPQQLTLNSPWSIAANPGHAWIGRVDLGVTNAGTEGIAVNPVSNKVYVTDGDGNRVWVFQDGDSGSLALPPQSITGSFDNPQGVGVNPWTNKIYVANARSSSDPYGTVTVIDGATDAVIKIIPLH